jgi:uncharacterized protein YcfJ
MDTSRIPRRSALAVMLGLAVAAGTAACERRVNAVAPPYGAAAPYGMPGAALDVWAPSHGQATTIPVTLPDGRQAHLVVAPNAAPPAYAAQPMVVRETVVAQPVRTVDRVRTVPLARTQARRVVRQNRGRSWQKEALIVGGSAGAGALIGSLAGGKKGAAIGAAAGGVGGLIYDLKTRDNVR